MVRGLCGDAGGGVGFTVSGGVTTGGVDSWGVTGAGTYGGGAETTGTGGVVVIGGAGTATTGFFCSQHPPESVSRALTSNIRTGITRWRSAPPETDLQGISKAL